mmetsp:Transcript_91349/g.257970  ORF Transcript_91349/g.257970 Transcript_91349/m.257970 type:complete len:297 (+) Transcript_91349:800-1690(+)
MAPRRRGLRGRLVRRRGLRWLRAERKHLRAETEGHAAPLPVPLRAILHPSGLLRLHRVDVHRATNRCGRDDAWPVRGPTRLVIALLRWDLTERLQASTVGEIPTNDFVVLAARQDQVRVRRIPSDIHNPLRVGGRLLERVLAIPQIPHLHRRVPIVVVSHEELRGDLRVPSDGRAPLAAGRVLETDDLPLLLQVPHDRGTSVGAGAEDVLDLPVPGAAKHLGARVLAGGSRRAEERGLRRLGDVNNLDFGVCPAGSHKVWLQGVELNAIHVAVVDRHAVKEPRVGAARLNYSVRVP